MSTMEHSESLVNLAAAMAKAQGAMENPHTNANNLHVRKKYADLAEVIKTVRPVLAEHGLSVVQLPGFDGEKVTLRNVLMHDSGEWLSDVASAPLGVQYAEGGRILPPSPQAVGMSITYLRRYSLAAICGVAQEDDDAASAQSSGAATNGASPTTATPTCPDCDGQMWDNREGKKNPRAPDFKCKDKECEGVYWPGEWPPQDGALADEAAEKDRLAGGVDSMIRELSGLNADRADRVRAAWDEALQVDTLTPDGIRKFGAKVKLALDEEKAAAQPAGVAADTGDDDLPF